MTKCVSFLRHSVLRLLLTVFSANIFDGIAVPQLIILRAVTQQWEYHVSNDHLVITAHTKQSEMVNLATNLNVETVTKNSTTSSNYSLYRLFCCQRFGNRCYLCQNDCPPGVATVDRK